MRCDKNVWERQECVGTTRTCGNDKNVWEKATAGEARTLHNVCNWYNAHAQAMGFTTAHITAAGQFKAERQATEKAKRQR